jgi:hypothetical protein
MLIVFSLKKEPDDSKPATPLLAAFATRRGGPVTVIANWLGRARKIMTCGKCCVHNPHTTH